MKKSVALLQNNGTPEDPRAAATNTRPPPPPPQRRARALERSGASPPAYVTLKFDDNGCCRIRRTSRGKASISDRDKEIVTNESYVVMPWKVVTMNGKNVTFAEAVDEIFSHHESKAKELERREKREKKLRGSTQNITKYI